MSAFTRAEAFAPATMANLGVGFDILGVAVEGAGDTVIAEFCDTDTGAVMLSIEGDGGQLPVDKLENVASVAVDALLGALGETTGIGLHLKKGLPIGSGLGSSAASAVAAVVAANALLGEPFTKEDLLPFALEGEAAVSGYHADNVAPALLGGMLLCNGTEIYQIRSLPVPNNLHLALVTPHVSVATAGARAVLPEAVSLKTLVHQTGAVALLIDAIYRGDVPEMARAMVQDAVVEPARAHLMPLLGDVRLAAEKAGALGLVISGAGPTLCAVCDDGAICDAVVDVMHNVYQAADIGCDVRHTYVIKDGAKVLSVE